LVANAGTAAVTNAVVANWVVFVDTLAVGAAGTPVKVGLESVASPSVENDLFFQRVVDVS
jgi:hypothetical protein